MKKLLFLVLLIPVFGWSQKKHTVGPKETLFSIGRMYNVHPRELAQYNNIEYGTGLSIGQVLKIPAKKTMEPLPPQEDAVKPVTVIKPVSTTAIKKTAPATLTPVFHGVQKKESLYQISKLYKVPVDNLKKWNKLTTDALSVGTSLIVGYTATDNTPVVIKEEPVTVPVTEPVKKPEPVVEKKVENAIEKNEPVQNNKPVEIPKPVVYNKDVNFKGGYFKSIFDNQSKANAIASEDGVAGVFKSTSGWNDGKYYCLHNTAAAGTIIKVTNKASGKSIYAKVLDIIPDLKQNAGLLIRISNAASEELGAGETNFECLINYSK